MRDQVTVDRINKLHPLLREEALLIYDEVEVTLTGRATVRYAFTLRSFEEQQALYDQGRITPGKKVTNAKPGQSYHNYGLAVDMVLIIDGIEASWDVKKDWDADKQSDWMEVVMIFKKYGWEWGGDWVTFKDMPHFQKTFGHNWKDLLKLHNEKEFIEGTTYINI